jgi:hypothetical protein
LSSLEGGALELSGVLGGAPSLDSNSAIRTINPVNLRSLRLDLSNLRQDQADLIFLGQSEERVAIHEYGESSRRLPCQA